MDMVADMAMAMETSQDTQDTGPTARDMNLIDKIQWARQMTPLKTMRRMIKNMKAITHEMARQRTSSSSTTSTDTATRSIRTAISAPTGEITIMDITIRTHEAAITTIVTIRITKTNKMPKRTALGMMAQ